MGGYKTRMSARFPKTAEAIGCQNPTILDGLLYVGCRSGEVLALKMDNGHQAGVVRMSECTSHFATASSCRAFVSELAVILNRMARSL